MKTERRSRLWAAMAAPLLLAVLCIGFYWKLTLSGDYVWFDQPDTSYIELPRVQFQAHAIQRSRFPLWDPNIWIGQPLIGQTQPGPLYPLNLLLCLLPQRGGYVTFAAYNWHYVLMHLVAALCCYWFCRDLKLSRGASLLAGCGFSFAGFIGNVAWLDVGNGALTTPLVFLFLLRATRGERPLRNAAFSGLVLGLAWLSGHHEIPILVTLTAMATWGWHVIQPLTEGKRPHWRLAALAVLSLAIAGLVGAAQLWPTWEFGRLAVRWVGLPGPVNWQQPVPYTIHSTYSLPVRGLLGTVLPAQARYADSSGYQGIVMVTLAALGLLAAWGRKSVRWLAAVAAGAVLYALGSLTPLHGLLYSLVPGLEKARVPVRALHLLTFAVPVLAAYGLDALWSPAARTWFRPLRRVLMALGALVLSVAVIYAVVQKSEVEEKVLFGALSALALAAVLAAAERGRLNPRSGAALVLGLMLVDIYWVITWPFPHRLEENRNKFSNSLLENRDVAEFLRAQPKPMRVLVDDNDVPVNFGDLHGIETMQGYVAGVPANLMELPMHTPRTQSLLGVGYRIARKPARPEETDLFAGRSGIHVYRLPQPMPRAWIVHQAESVKNGGELRVKLDDPGFDFSRRAAVIGPAPGLGSCSGDGDTVYWHNRGTDHLKLTSRTGCRGLLVVADTFYPGWRARVDGRPAPLIEVFGALRGVVVEAGVHTVEMRYLPVSVLGGACFTALGLVLAMVAVRRGR